MNVLLATFHCLSNVKKMYIFAVLCTINDVTVPIKNGGFLAKVSKYVAVFPALHSQFRAGSLLFFAKNCHKLIMNNGFLYVFGRSLVAPLLTNHTLFS